MLIEVKQRYIEDINGKAKLFSVRAILVNAIDFHKLTENTYSDIILI